MVVTNRTYTQLARMLEPWLERPIPRLVPVGGSIPAASCAVYVALNSSERVTYVGSVCRPGSRTALADRLAEHRALGRWSFVVVFPIRPETELGVVRRLEGAVGRILMPTDNARLPSARSVAPVPRTPRRAA